MLKVERVDLVGEQTKKIHMALVFLDHDDEANKTIAQQLQLARRMEFSLCGRDQVLLNFWQQWYDLVGYNAELAYVQRFGKKGITR